MKSLRRNNLPIIWLALAGALLLRSLVPAGWMPMVDNGAIRIMLCDGAGPVELSPPAAAETQMPAAHDQHAAHSQHAAHNQHGGGDHENAPHDPCPFGLALGHALDVPEAPPILAPLHPGTIIDSPALTPARLVARRGIRPPARAPPILA